MKIYALEVDEGLDYHSYVVILHTFSWEFAEYVRDCLVGKPAQQGWQGTDGVRIWRSWDFEIEEYDIVGPVPAIREG